MSRFIILTNCCIDDRWITHWKEERERRIRRIFLDFEKYFGHMTTKQKIARMGVGRFHYTRLKKKYKPFTKEELDNEDIIENCSNYLTR